MNNIKKINTVVWSGPITENFEDFYEYVFFPVMKRVGDFDLIVCAPSPSEEEKNTIKKISILPKVTIIDSKNLDKLPLFIASSKLWVGTGINKVGFNISAKTNIDVGNAIVSPINGTPYDRLADIPYLKNLNIPILSKETAYIYVDIISSILLNEDVRLAYAKECKEFYKL